MKRAITRWKNRWNNSFPLRLAMRTGLYLALVLFVIISCSYASMAWLLNRSTDATLAINANSIIAEWGEQGRIVPIKWHDLSYRVLQTDGTSLGDDELTDLSPHGRFDHHRMANSSDPIFSVRTEKDGPLLTGSQAMLYQLLPLGHAERVVTIPFAFGANHYLLEACVPLQQTHNFLGSVLAVFALISLGGFLFILRVMIGSTKKGFQPVEQIANMLKDVQERTLSTRLESGEITNTTVSAASIKRSSRKAALCRMPRMNCARRCPCCAPTSRSPCAARAPKRNTARA